MVSRFSNISAIVFCVGSACWGQYTISTFAGTYYTGQAQFSGDGGPANAAQLAGPSAIAVSGGNVYIVDGGNQRIRVVQSGTINTYAGNGTPGYAGDGAAATNANLYSPAGIAVDSSGNVYIADAGNNVVRVVSGSNINTFAGNNGYGPGYSGDGGTPTNAQLNNPTGIAVDSSGNVYIADTKNNLIRVVTQSNGLISTLTGTGSGKLNNPTGIALDAQGNLYICDTGNYRIMKYTASTRALTTFAGNATSGFSGDGGPATRAELKSPTGVAVDAAGNVYIADTINNRIRVVTTDGNINTIAGSSSIGYSGDGGPATSAALQFPHSVSVDSSGNVYIADSQNNVIRLLQAPAPTIISGGVVNAADFSTNISPGAFASIVGSNLSGPNPPSPGLPLPATLGGVTVSINGKNAPLLYVSSTLINFQVPWETALGTANVVVTVGTVSSNTASANVITAAPGIFQLNGAAIAQNFHNGAITGTNGPSAPAHAGDTLVVYMNGTGPVNPPVVDGTPAPSTPLSVAATSATATINGQSATTTYTGMAPTLLCGIVNVTVPTGLAAGTYPLKLTIGGQTSVAANVTVAP